MSTQEKSRTVGHINEDRSFIVYVILSVLTCGLYAFYFVHTLARDVNKICAEDGRKVGGLVAYIILSYLTFGLYHVYWKCKIADRLRKNAPLYNLEFSAGPITMLALSILGLFVFVGPFIATYILIHNTNKLAHAFNNQA